MDDRKHDNVAPHLEKRSKTEKPENPWIHNDSSMRIQPMPGPEIDTLPDSLEVYEKRMEQAMNDFCMLYDIESLKTASQNTFSACMYYVYRQVFKPSKPLRYNCKSVLDYSNIELLSGLCEWFIFTCQVNDKIANIGDYCKLLGLDAETIRLWKVEYYNNTDKASTEKFGIFKRLFDAKEDTLENTLLSNKNSIGVLAILNHRYGWNMPHVSREESKPKLSRDELLQGLDALPGKESSQISLPMQDSQEND